MHEIVFDLVIRCMVNLKVGPTLIGVRFEGISCKGIYLKKEIFNRGIPLWILLLELGEVRDSKDWESLIRDLKNQS